MIIFQRPLDAVLAAVRMQKSLRRFNRYRDENSRVMIRIGIHSGKVVRKEKGDVLGNAVNIASRLESSANPGSILISDKVQADVKDSSTRARSAISPSRTSPSPSASSSRTRSSWISLRSSIR